MKGVILAGGTGSRLWPLTAVVNKHLIPVWRFPMIYFPLGTLVEAGIEDIMIVTGGNNAGKFLELLGSGEAFGLKHLQYGYQRNAGGIAEALRVSQNFVNGDKCVVILGDNCFGTSLRPSVEKFAGMPRGANVILANRFCPVDFGVAIFDEHEHHIIEIREKPDDMVDEWGQVVTGAYFYDQQVWDILPQLERSGRGELEISDVNQAYIDRGQLFHDELPEGVWEDAGGDVDALKAASAMAERLNLLSEFALDEVA